MIVGYLDTNIVSGIAREDLSGADLNALEKILEASKKGTISLVTSKFVKEEIDKIPELYRRKHLYIYYLFMDVPVAPAFRRDRFLSVLSFQFGFRLQPMLAQLITLLKDEADAYHIYQAARNSAQYFITADSRTILSNRSRVEQIANIKPVSPEDFLSTI